MPGKIVMGGVQSRTSNADGRSIRDIPACWQDYLSRNMASKIPHRAKTPAMFAVYSDYESDWTGEYAYMIGSEVTKADTIPQGLAVVRIPAQTYVFFTAAGPMPDSILGVWVSIWGDETSPGIYLSILSSTMPGSPTRRIRRQMST